MPKNDIIIDTTDDFISWHCYNLSAHTMSIICVLKFTQLMLHRWQEHTMDILIMIRREFRRLQASARTIWLVRLTQQRQLWCHLATLVHLLGIEQCPIWCPVWVSLWLTVMVDMVDSRERKIHWGSHHETEMQHAISRKGCRLTFQRWHKTNIFIYNVPCVENEKVATSLRNGLPY